MVEDARPEDKERKLRYITKHFAQRHFCFDNLCTGTVIHSFQHTPTTVQVTGHITHVLIRRYYFYFHDRFQ